jgi:glyoxylase-like metal-dependent hydrolase (beta-lactamase superfamily II)
MSLHQLLIVRYGTRRARRNDHFLNYGLYGEPDGPMDIDYFFWVAVGARGPVLVDCGFSRRAGDRRGRTTLVDPAEALRGLGIEPAEVGTVVITHAHYDHMGNLDLFPRARVIVAASEVDFWRSRTARHVLFDHYAERSEIEELAKIEADGRLVTFSGRAEPVPGLVVTEVGGHTPGQAIVELTTGEGPVLLASDAVHFYEELDRSMPFSAIADLPAMYAAYELIEERLAQTGAALVTGHDTATKERFRAHPGEHRAWVGVVGAPVTAG